MKAKHYWIALACLAVFFTGCSVGPDLDRAGPSFKVPQAYEEAPKEGEAAALPDPNDPWWTQFSNPELDRMVERALARNLDVQKATARVLELLALSNKARADRYPTVGFSAEAKRQYQGAPAVSIPGVDSGGDATASYGLALPASFELDLWKKLQSLDEASQKDLLQAENTRRALAQTVAAEAASLYLEMEALERKVAKTDESIAAYTKNLNLVEMRYRRGLAPILDVKQASRLLAQAQSLLPGLRQSLGIVQQQLAVLAGDYPKTRPSREQPGDYYQKLAPVPAGLPSELLQRRPDVAAAEAGLEGAASRVKAARAARFPTIKLTGSYGYSTQELGEIVNPDSMLWSLAAGLTAPVLDFGRLASQEEAARARYEQAVLEYNKTALNAFMDVERALLSRQEQLERRSRVVVFLDQAVSTERVALSRYERGLSEYLVVLDAQQSRFAAEITLIDVDLAIYQARVSLYRALGGGWDQAAIQNQNQKDAG